ncbi:sialin-like [Penaeus chinensis]|uniref:sialin-like n=1 Tax=Penaeus chinensis TaxID=139456 RepID=UPI001FB8578C|nr:sialin-like [Penaeus chinensis]
MAPRSGYDVESESIPLLGHPVKTGWERKPLYTMVVLGCLGTVVEYCQRVSLSVAIVAMTGVYGNKSRVLQDPSSTNHKDGGEFPEWDAATQGLVLGSFFLGYAASSLAGGRGSEHLGGRKLYAAGIVVSSLLALLSPTCARTSAKLFAVIRMLQGAAQGVTFPAINVMLATWILPAERAKFTTIVCSGSQLGTVVGTMASGWLCSSSVLGGWPLPFYVFGASGLVWALAWWCLVSERPEDHPGLSEAELKKLKLHQECVKGTETVDIPWLALAKSLPFWALTAATVGNDYGLYTLLMQLPTYLRDVLRFDLGQNGIVSTLPSLLMWISSLGWAALMDMLTVKGKSSVVTVRRLSMVAALLGPMFGLIAMCFVKYDAVLTITVLLVSAALSGAANSGFLCSHQDLAPNLAGTLLGITKSVGAVAGVINPAISSLILHREDIMVAWRDVFIISAAMYFISCVGYLAFISADVQPWNCPHFLRGTLMEEKAYVRRRRKEYLQDLGYVFHHPSESKEGENTAFASLIESGPRKHY